jgi:hypothetical protein
MKQREHLNRNPIEQQPVILFVLSAVDMPLQIIIMQ